MRYCVDYDPNITNSDLKSRLSDMERSSKALDDGSVLYINICAFLVYHDVNDNVSDENIIAQTQQMSLDLTMTNADIDHVPTSGQYNFSSDVGNCNVVVILKDIKRIKSSSPMTFSGLSSIENYIRSSTALDVPVSGLMNMYIGTLRDGLLGQAELLSNRMVVASGSVGSFLVPGSITNYNFGRVGTHEIGHALGLPHTFSGTCDQTFSDIPAQVNPNYDAFLFETSPGVWDGRLDNRFRDCNQPTYNIPGEDPPYGCPTDCILGPYEQFMNYMDYSTDENVVMFSVEQAANVRNFVLNGGVFVLQDGSDQEVTTEDITASDGSALETWEIVLIVIGSLLLVTLIVLLSVYLTKYRSTVN